MKSKLKLLLILMSAALNVAFIGCWLGHTIHGTTHGRPPSPAATNGAPMPALYQQLGATEAQWQQIRPQLENFRGRALAVFGRINEQRQDLLTLLAAPRSDRGGILEKQREIRAAQAQMQELVIAHVLAEKELLNPAQRQRYFELLAQRSGALCENLMDGLHPATAGADRGPLNQESPSLKK